MPERTKQDAIKNTHPIGILLGSMVVAFILCTVTGAIIWFLPDRTPVVYPTAVVKIIPAPTYTPTLEVTIIPTAVRDNSGENGVKGEPIFLGAYVEIKGTEGDGLRLRKSPSLDGNIQFLAYESEIFRVEDGPTEADGYVWWFLVAPYDERVRGWAVENYLFVVQHP